MPGDAALAELLARSPIFAGLDPASLAAIGALLRRRQLGAGEVLFEQGEPVRDLFVIERGLVKAFVLTPAGRQQTINLLGAGEVVPHVGFLEGSSYPATATALEESVVWALGRRPLMELLRRDALLAIRLLEITARRLAELQRRLQETALGDLRQRVAYALVRLASEHGRGEGRWRTLPPHITHQEIANLAGVSRESVSRTMGRFLRNGWVREGADGQRLDLEALAREVEGFEQD
ncbi:MAG: Crp/Fnr family transcriptional regulator [Clostridia bacterium]|nr:Crp/Fnr family transcriptional regulator [Clostridia bacterium]